MGVDDRFAELTPSEYVRQKLREEGFGIDSFEKDEPHREYAILHDILETTKEILISGPEEDEEVTEEVIKRKIEEIRTALGTWGLLTNWAVWTVTTDSEGMPLIDKD